MRIYKVGEKLIPDAVLLNIMGKLKGISFRIAEKEMSGDRVSVLVRGEVKVGIFRRIVEEEWVEIDLKELARQFCIEKYGEVPSEDSPRFIRELTRARLVGTRYAVGLAKKRIESRFVGEEFRDAFEKNLEVVELLNIYQKRHLENRNGDYLKKLKEDHPEVYQEVIKKFSNPDRVRFRTDGQNAKIHALVRELGIADEDYRKLLKSMFGVSSSLALTRDEASRLIVYLESLKKRKVP